MTATASKLLATYEWEPAGSDLLEPVAAQIGGVARSSVSCLAAYRRRSNSHIRTATIQSLGSESHGVSNAAGNVGLNVIARHQSLPCAPRFRARTFD